METVIYILIGIAYFIYQIMKESRKLKEQAKRPDQEFPAPQTPPKPIIHETSSPRKISHRPDHRTDQTEQSIEELLKDLKKEKKKPVKEARSTSPFSKKTISNQPRERTRMEKIIDEEEIALEKIRKDREEGKLLGSSLLKEDIKLKQEKKQNPYAAFFKNPESVKTAFIASEIFNRKF